MLPEPGRFYRGDGSQFATSLYCVLPELGLGWEARHIQVLLGLKLWCWKSWRYMYLVSDEQYQEHKI